MRLDSLYSLVSPIELTLPCDARYKSRSYRARAVREPRAVLREFGLQLPEDRRLVVHDSTADMR